MDRPVKCKTMNDKKSTNSSPILPDLNVLNIKSSKLGRVATLHGKGGGARVFLVRGEDGVACGALESEYTDSFYS